ncbi:hypothetical protein TI03_02975 [Achromatium sp. WMS1]|nr:hypothetical protein TI03_02975 [Achromatium sp. WMS1]
MSNTILQIIKLWLLLLIVAIFTFGCGGKINCNCNGLQEYLQVKQSEQILGTKGFHNLDLAIYIDHHTPEFVAYIDSIIKECGSMVQDVKPSATTNCPTNSVTTPECAKTANQAKPYSCPLFTALQIAEPQQRTMQIDKVRQYLIAKYREHLRQTLQITNVKGCEDYAAKAVKNYVPLATPNRNKAEILFKYYQQCLLEQYKQ